MLKRLRWNVRFASLVWHFMLEMLRRSVRTDVCLFAAQDRREQDL